MTDTSLTYLYAVVPIGSPEPPPELVGLEGGPVRLIRLEKVAGVASEVPFEQYNEETLNARLEDLNWVGERGLAHEQVVNWLADQGPVVPLSLFSLFRDEDSVRSKLSEGEGALVQLLARLKGRREWAIKLWRTEAAAEGIDQLSPSLQALSKQIDEAAQGRKFLLERKRNQMRGEELRMASKRIAHEVFAALTGAAETSSQIPVAGAEGEKRTLLLHSAYLVRDDQFDAFQAAVNQQAGRLVDSGFEMEFTGPWPPYHFTGSPS